MRQSFTQSLKTGFVVLVVAAVGTTGVALAQTTDEADPADPPAATEDGTRGFRGGHRHGHAGARGFGGVINETADATGLAVQDILDQLGDGSTIAGIATANGSSGTAIVDALIADMSDRLDGAVADERLTAEEAAEKLAAAEERLNELVETPDPIGAQLEERQERIEERLVQRAEQHQALLDVLGMTDDELRAALSDGQTLGDVADAQGVPVDAVVDVLAAPMAERLDEAVASGDLTQAEADEKLAEIAERITTHIEDGAGFGRGFGGRGGRGGPRGGDAGPGPGGPGFGASGGVGAGFGIQTGATIDA